MCIQKKFRFLGSLRKLENWTKRSAFPNGSSWIGQIHVWLGHMLAFQFATAPTMPFSDIWPPLLIYVFLVFVL